jgi:ADP-ribose pyrophosphatase YjhB (NUDIX family)
VIAFRGEEVLLVRRGKPPRLGSWSLPGGAQHLGEGTQEAARRELREETSIEVGPLLLADVIDAVSTDSEGRVRFHYTIIDYAAHWLAGEAQAGDDVSELAWATIEALPAYELTPEALAVIALARMRLAERPG